MREYENSLTEEQKQLWEQKKKEYTQVNNKKKYEVLGKPKKPSNAYLSYLSSKRKDKNPDMHVKDWVRSMTVNWNTLSDEEKEPYLTEAMQLNAQYQKDLEKWEMQMIRSGNSDLVRSKTLLKYKDANREEQQ
ncbi:Transcription factor A, mitochondrial [Melipona quadrifasciata]|uniref:Transcription factor A, mitochondrial n=1 Tax=Melipona quadrifasciata TaxID=166423 RepID=A0A0M8ZN60_9HYME|nr:Transcription factor A, mitochondrial [Melipona quadrifasciata]